MYSGTLTVDQEIAIVTEIIEDPHYRKGMNVYCDLSKATVVWSLEELDRFRAFVARIKKVTGHHNWAILIPHGKDNTTARIFTALHDALEDTIDVRLFHEPDDAMNWLKRSTAQ